MTQTPTDKWPTSDEPTVMTRQDTLIDPAPPVAPAGPPPDRRVGAGMLLALGVIALVAAGLVLAWFLTHRDDNKQATTVVVTTTGGPPAAQKVTVPRLVGLKEEVALVRLGQVGLRPKEVFRPTKKPKNHVVSQSPGADTKLAKGGRVTLVIDSGAPKVVMPDLTGQSFTDARAKLDKLGLDSTRTQVTSTQPAGTVVDQSPKGGARLAKGSVVTLSVAKKAASPQPTTTTAQTTTAQTTTAQTTTAQTTTASAPPQPQNATVPDVEGQKENAAVQALNQAGILASLFFVPSHDPLGTVEKQAKASGTTVPYRSHMQINVSTGPGDKPKEQVPSVIGKTLPDALSAVNGANLRLIYVKYAVSSKAQAGKIVQQSPLAGGQAPQNAQVLVYLGAYRVQ